MRCRSLKINHIRIFCMSVVKNGLPFYILLSVGAVCLALLFVSPAWADRLCVGEPLACGKADFCVTHVTNMTWANYEKWLNTGQYTYHEILATSATYIRVQYRDQCVEKDTCWDSAGSCMK